MERVISAYIQELQLVIELINDGKRFGAKSIHSIIRNRYDESSLNTCPECKHLSERIDCYLADADDRPALAEIRIHYQRLKEKFL